MFSELLAHGIHKVPDTRISNSYILETKEGLIIIDSGIKADASRIISFINKLGKEPSSVYFIVLTHSDADHSGGASELRERTKARIGIHELDAPRVSGEKALKESSGLGNAVIKLFSYFMAINKFKPDVMLKDGDKIGPLTVIYTPGHTDGSICLYMPSVALFSGDTILTSNNGKLRLPAGYLNKDTKRLKESVKRLKELEFSILLPGHGIPLLSRASNRLKEFAEKI